MAKSRQGYTYEDEGGWWARLTFVDAAGKRRNIRRRVENRTEGKELIKQLIRELEDSDDTIIDSTRLTVNDYFDQWLAASAKPRLSERTYADYEDLLRRYIKPALGRKKLLDLKALDIQSLYSSMLARKLSARTVRYTHAVIFSALKQAVKWGMIVRNPAAMVDLPKQARKEMQALSPEEATRFLEAAKSDRWGLLFAFALMTGTRPEEYLAVQWKDIDFRQGIVIIQRTVCWRRREGGWYFGEPKTSRSRRSIPLPTFIMNGLSEHKRKQAEERLKAGAEYKNLDLVFATAEGGPLMPQNLLRRHFKPILKLAELPETIRLYDLRHSCATLLLSNQENPKVVSERLGHASITLTLDVYSHVLPSMQQSATQKLESLLIPKVKKVKNKK